MKRLAFTLLVAVALTGCAAVGSPSNSQASTGATVNEVNNATDRLAEALTARSAGPMHIVVASAVKIDDLTQSSTFGRAVGEQMAARFANRGLSVSELKLRSSIFVSKADGEFVLSRDVAEISASHKVQVVIAGTYAVSGPQVPVTMKVIEVSSNRVLAGHTFTVPKSYVWSMLN